jgi:hypothetical protein
MDRPIKVNFQGREADAVEVDFKTIKEDWNEYDLADGTRVKVKSVASNMVRLIDEYDNDGNPIYLVKSSNVLALSVPENLKRGKDKETKKIH